MTLWRGRGCLTPGGVNGGLGNAWGVLLEAGNEVGKKVKGMLIRKKVSVWMVITWLGFWREIGLSEESDTLQKVRTFARSDF